MWDITRAFTRLKARQGEIERNSGYIEHDREVVTATLFASGAPFIRLEQSIEEFLQKLRMPRKVLFNMLRLRWENFQCTF